MKKANHGWHGLGQLRSHVTDNCSDAKNPEFAGMVMSENQVGLPSIKVSESESRQ